ncbi:MAG: DUF4384 domain-containing protein, partial [candidate division WOR-3 bacterium]
IIGLNTQTDSIQLPENPINIQMWLNKEEPAYIPGERLKVFFKADKDCFVAVFNIDVGGRENLLFPQQGDNGFIRANRVYELPSPDADYEYEITGPEGTERIIILASTKGLPDLEDVESVSRKEIEISIEEPEPAKLRIISTPSKCRIYIKEVMSGERIYVGRTPHTIVLRPGEYIVEIKKLGYQTIRRRIFLEPNDKRRVYVNLLPW